ncbi:hypothetical protein [Lutibacter sp.]|uniref:hypothetical protein n=1 Tax=Lutibacter sp. TaxID=1925666 RepID=UPI001A24A1BD|nr:hypothetical protein [Lutibacter sp.]MBI9042455.1 hypothetical protein [Lutibacter sp.]
MLHRNIFIALSFLLIFNGCTNNEQLITTGLKGQMFRGPIAPVVVDGQLNDAPFSAKFFIYTSKNKKITSFVSNENGEYMVLLSPGNYKVVPDKSAPILGAEFQTKEVIVNSVEITNLDLYFDTGIR